MTAPSPSSTHSPSLRHEIEGRLRRPSHGSRPRLSIVVAADVPRHWLEALSSAVPSIRAAAIEVLIMRPSGGTAGRRHSEERDARHPMVRYIAVPSGTTSAQLMAQGIRQASGDFVMLLDDDRPFDPSILDRLIGVSSPMTDRDTGA